jgi:hypothetical protein
LLIAAFRFLNSPQKYLTIVYTPNKELRKNLTFLLSQPHQNCIFPHFIALFWPQDEIASLVDEWGRRSGYSSGGYAIRLNVRLPTPRRGNDTSAQGNALGTGCSKYSALKGQKNKAHTRRLWEGEAAFHSFAPAGATLTYKQIPKALPWAELLLAFQAVSTQADIISA